MDEKQEVPKKFIVWSMALHALLLPALLFFHQRPPLQQNIPVRIVDYLPKNIGANPKDAFLRLGVSKPSIESSHNKSIASPSLTSPSPTDLKTKLKSQDPETQTGKESGSVLNIDKSQLLTSPSSNQTLSSSTITPKLSSSTSNTSKAPIANTAPDPLSNQNETSEQPSLESLPMQKEFNENTEIGDARYVSEKNIYLGTIRSSINRNWRLMKDQLDRKEFLIYRLILSPQGDIVNVIRLEGNANAIAINSVERAIRISAPFPRFPSTFPKNRNFSMKIRFAQESLDF